MTRPTLEELLAPAPRSVRESMLAQRNTLRPGSAAAVGRFFALAAERGEHWTAPSRESFDAAALSESTLQILLSALGVHAPQVALGPGREARRAWYARRSSGSPRRRKGPAPVPAEAPKAWPETWRDLYSGLREAPIKPSSIRRYVASIDQCAGTLKQTDAAPDLGFYMGWCLFEVFRQAGLGASTVAGYLDALNALALHAGRSKDERAGLIRVRTYVGRLAMLAEKEKTDRIRTFVESGGFATIAEVIADLRDAALAAPAWTARAEHARQTAAILGVSMTAPARTGDVAAWRIGHELVRHPSGDWELAWTQEKSGRETDFGLLWPEISELIDAHVLAGRPDRLIPLRYEELVGQNWLTLGPLPYASRWPSEQVKTALGVPLHDLRTIAADYLRRHGPRTAAGTVSALLGHSTRKAGESYRAMTEGEAAARDWRAMRDELARDKAGALMRTG